MLWRELAALDQPRTGRQALIRVELQVPADRPVGAIAPDERFDRITEIRGPRRRDSEAGSDGDHCQENERCQASHGGTFLHCPRSRKRASATTISMALSRA